MKYASVIVNISHGNLDKIYEYAIPEEWESCVQIGTQVLIPFGAGNRQIKGFVLGLSSTSEFDPKKIKPISSVITDGTILESHFIQLAAWMRERYGSTMNDALRAVLPVKRKVKEKQKKYLHLVVEQSRLDLFIEECEKKGNKARLRLATVLKEFSTIEMAQAIKEHQVSRDAIKALERLGILVVSTKKVYRNPIPIHISEDYRITLTQAQQSIVNAIIENVQCKKLKPCLLRGITGSGKTEIYMEIMDDVITQKKQVIFLIPEIALTVSMMERFYQRFGDRITVLHSKLSEGERSDQYERAKNGEVDIVIGPRSALFTPFERLGLIIIDEEHEPVYQNENQPKYHTREVAIQRAKMCEAMVLMGSATPSIESYYKAMSGEYQLFTLEERANGSLDTEVSIVDLREELKRKNMSIFSRSLVEQMRECLTQKKQVLLFINRRGYAGFVSCRACGQVLHCPHCDVSLTEHKNNMLMCHYCGYVQKRPKKCPSCGSPYIAAFGIGTQKVEEYARQEFPNARILRMDGDTTSKKGEYSKILQQFNAGEADILIGTQMIVKGHDFANVALVAAMAADLSLNMNDFRSAERTFQLLYQAAGRAGRRKDAGKMIIQTYQPEHYSLKMVENQDYVGFYEKEMLYRKILEYPPFGVILAIVVVSKSEQKVTQAAMFLKGAAVEKQTNGVTIIGPANATVYRVSERYRKLLYIKAKQLESVLEIKSFLEGFVHYSEAFRQVSVYYDLNPMNGY